MGKGGGGGKEVGAEKEASVGKIKSQDEMAEWETDPGDECDARGNGLPSTLRLLSSYSRLTFRNPSCVRLSLAHFMRPSPAIRPSCPNTPTSCCVQAPPPSCRFRPPTLVVCPASPSRRGYPPFFPPRFLPSIYLVFSCLRLFILLSRRFFSFCGAVGYEQAH